MKNLLIAFFSLTALSSTAQISKNVSSNDFILECMKNNGEVPHRQMALWFPYNFWQIVGDKMNVSPDYVEEITKEMSNYMVFAVVDYTILNGGLIFQSQDEIGKTIKLYDSSKTVYLPIGNKNLSPGAAQLLKNLQPIMAQMLGQFGEGMQLFVFDAKQKNGKPVIDITQSNNFTLSWDQTNMKWTLPFASVLEPKFCPVDHEQMKGNWNFCPFHGSKLVK